MKIVFAVDGSHCSKEAIATALTMRCPAGTELLVVSAVDFLEDLPSIEGIPKKEIARPKNLCTVSSSNCATLIHMRP